MDYTKTGSVQDLATGHSLPAPVVIMYFGKEHGTVRNPHWQTPLWDFHWLAAASVLCCFHLLFSGRLSQQNGTLSQSQNQGHEVKAELRKAWHLQDAL